MLRACSSHNDYTQELPRFNQKRLEKCSTEKGQPYQPKLVAVETFDPNKTRPRCGDFRGSPFAVQRLLECKSDITGHGFASSFDAS